jgi:hypothetical protein
MEVCSPWHDKSTTRLLHDQLKGHTMAALMQWSAAANISEAVVALTILKASGVSQDAITRSVYTGNHHGSMTALRAMAANLVDRVDADTSLLDGGAGSGLDGTVASPDSQANKEVKVRRPPLSCQLVSFRFVSFRFVSFRFVPAMHAAIDH